MNLRGKSSKESLINTNNPAYKISNFSRFSQKVFQELDSARMNPQAYAKKVLNMMDRFNEDDNILNINGYGISISEGKEVFLEAINFLKSAPSLPALNYSNGISKSADELLNLLILHDGIPDMSEIERKNYDLEKRMNHYGAAFGELNELIDYGTFDPDYVILNFIVCDGDKLRNERNIVFNPYVKYCGISSGLLPSEKICTVINFSEYFYNPGEVVPDTIISRYTSKNTNTSRNEDFNHGFQSMNLNYNNYNIDNNLTNTKYYNSAGFQEKEYKPVKKKNSVKLLKEKADNYKNYITYENQSYNKQESDDNQDNYKEDNGKENLQDSFNDSPQDPFDLPEGVEKIKYIEKVVFDKSTNSNRTVVKKITYYTDGSTDITIYKKK